jgi:hypothetical protein
MDENVLEGIYQENLDERIIDCLSKEMNVPYEQAMDNYYNSRLSSMIHSGQYGIQYLDYKVLTHMLLESELQGE